ncbi:hypothetical protein GQ54DRAFT_115813 [Martensiomyces pterosporus]|nr:hypothetical protein GQ54DRAFT_115813 [Martensiomyces pterosporus]
MYCLALYLNTMRLAYGYIQLPDESYRGLLVTPPLLRQIDLVASGNSVFIVYGSTKQIRQWVESNTDLMVRAMASTQAQPSHDMVSWVRADALVVEVHRCNAHSHKYVVTKLNSGRQLVLRVARPGEDLQEASMGPAAASQIGSKKPVLKLLLPPQQTLGQISRLCIQYPSGAHDLRDVQPSTAAQDGSANWDTETLL